MSTATPRAVTACFSSSAKRRAPSAITTKSGSLPAKSRATSAASAKMRARTSPAGTISRKAGPAGFRAGASRFFVFFGGFVGTMGRTL